MQVAVLGAGYAGLTLARRLERSLPADADLVVVDESDHHLVRHEVHRAIRRPDVAEDLRIPLADVLESATLRQAQVRDVDTAAGVATLDDGSELEYDVGAVCLGSVTDYHDLPGLADHATPLKDLDDAATVRRDFLDVAATDGTATVVVGGAGLSGIQVAGELAVLAEEEGVGDVVEIRLLEQAVDVAPGFPRKFRSAVATALEDRGVVVETGTTVTEADDERVHLAEDSAIEYDQLVWTGGITGPRALGGDRPQVRAPLRFEDGTFVVGDAARVVDADGTAVPASAQSAVKAARVAADNVSRLAEYRLGDRSGFEPRLRNFRFDAPGWLVSVGDGAVAQVGSAVFTGPAAKTLKTTVGAGYLTSVGSVRQAVDLVSDALDLGDDEGATAEAVPDPAAVQDGPLELDVDDGN